MSEERQADDDDFDDWRKRPRTEVEQVLADKVPARVVGAAIGSAIGSIGGPGVAMLGAWAGSGASPIIELLLKRGNERFLRSAEDVIATAGSSASMSPEQVASWIEESPEHLEIMAAAVRSAFETLDARKLASLARALQVGLNDDAKIDEARLAIGAIAQLENMHVRVLQHLVHRERQGGPRTRLEDLFPGLTAGMPRIIAMLEREGLVMSNGGQERSVSPFGKYLYWLIRSSGGHPTTPFYNLSFGTTRGFDYACRFICDCLGADEYSEETGRDDIPETSSRDLLEKRWYARTANVDEMILVMTGKDPVMWVKHRTRAGRKTKKTAHADFAVVSIVSQRPEEVRRIFDVKTFEQMWNISIEKIPFHDAERETH
jgi:hypothetical protein